MDQEKLLKEIREALKHMKYMSISTGYPRTLVPHHVEAIMEAVTPVIKKYQVQYGKLW